MNNVAKSRARQVWEGAQSVRDTISSSTVHLKAAAQHVKHVRRVDVSWAERVHPDPLGTQFAGHAARHLDDSRLGAVVAHPGVVLS